MCSVTTCLVWLCEELSCTVCWSLNNVINCCPPSYKIRMYCVLHHYYYFLLATEDFLMLKLIYKTIHQLWVWHCNTIIITVPYMLLCSYHYTLKHYALFLTLHYTGSKNLVVFTLLTKFLLSISEGTSVFVYWCS